MGHVNDTQALGLVVRELNRHGILLESDKSLPSVTGLIIGKRMSGSWWSHPKGKMIWRVLNKFVIHREVLATRLVSGKVTFVHRRLWPEFLAIATSRHVWQIDSLSPEASGLLTFLDREGRTRTDNPRWRNRGEKPIANTSRELEQKLLVHSEEVHTESGFHAKLLRSWDDWRRNAKFGGRALRPEPSESKFERLVRNLNVEYGGRGRLPWTASSRSGGISPQGGKSSQNRFFVVPSSIKGKKMDRDGALGVTVKYLIGKEQGASKFFLREYHVSPGGNTSLDNHAYEHEVYILHGTARVRVGEMSRVVREGAVIFVPSNVIHQFRNAGPDALVFLCVKGSEDLYEAG
jgi:quercetin dioxygenase-like cupin family protein